MKTNINVQDYGWTTTLETQWFEQQEALPAQKRELVKKGRILLDYGQRLKVWTPEDEKWIQRPTQSAIQLAVGDWVGITQDPYQKEDAHLEFVLPRKTKFSRLAAGNEVKEQIIATNVDVVFLVQSLNNDFNPRRLERYLIATWESGAMPVVVLTKSDLCDDFAQKIKIVNDIAFGVDVHAISALTGDGLATIKPYFKPGTTIALLGSSGVGKSTLVNTLMGHEILETQGIREYDSKGRHTTTHRELILLPDGGLILDTPGMRSLALWDSEEGISQLFGDIEALLGACRFNNCNHKQDSGCAIQSALKSGELKRAHWDSWIKLQKEQRILDSKIRRKQRLADKITNTYTPKKDTKSVVVRRAASEY